MFYFAGGTNDKKVTTDGEELKREQDNQVKTNLPLLLMT